MKLDFIILEYIQTYLRSDFLDAFMPFATKLGNGGILWILCALALLLYPKTRTAGVAMAISLILEVIGCNLLLKPLVARIRPYDVNTAVQLLVRPPIDYSFPSGHTCASFAAASSLLFCGNRGWITAFMAAVLIAFSRLYLYVHYPTDVLAGVLLGILFGWLGARLAPAMEKKLRERFHVFD